ncbi:hypothetical protein ACOMHN_005167 [Nucella lapillus]
MPTLRRSKSLNDKIGRQKNRSGDVVRDPRSPDVEGRTRTCVDNFQALVHLRKQTEDKARQLELAYSYATNGHTYLRRGPSGGVELPYPASTTTLTSTTLISTSTKPSSRHPDPAPNNRTKPPVPLVPRRQHSAEGRAGSVLRRQESFSETSAQHQSRREQKKGQQRPLSMVEPRVVGGGLFPSKEELARKEQVIQNLTESQRSLNTHNQQLLGKVDELEFENNRLRDLLSSHNVQYGTYSSPPHPHPAPLNLHHHNHHHHNNHHPAQYPGTRAQRSISLHGDALKVGSVPHHALVSPHSETSVSGYGSLVDSPSGEGLAGGGGEGKGGRVGDEDENDDTLPLSGVSECSLEYHHDTLEKTSSSSASSSSRISRAATLNSDRSERDSPRGGGRGGGGGGGRMATGDGEEEEEEEEEEWGNPRIEELAKQVAELSSQRDTVLLRYKQLVEDNLRILKRDKRVQEELGGLVDTFGPLLEETVQSELHILREQLKDFAEDVEVEVQRVLAALDCADSASPGQLADTGADFKDPQVRDTLDRLLDLIGPDYQRLGPDYQRLGRRLTVPQPELDRLERKGQGKGCALRAQAMLRVWLKRRGGAGPSGAEVPAAVRHLLQALKDMDKDMQHCKHSTVSGPERQALRNCLQAAIDHVADPRDLLDHLIALNELTPAGIAFVQEVLEKRERAVCRLWHVSEYRGTGMVSRLALALDRSHCPQLAHRLRDELEIQNSRLHTQCHSPSEEPAPAPTTNTTTTTTTTTTNTTTTTFTNPTPPPPPQVSTTPTETPPAESRPSTNQVRSRPISRVPRLRSKTFDSTSPPVVKPTPDSSAIPAAARDRVTPLRQMSASGPERGGSRPQRDRPFPAALKDRAAPAVREARSNSNSNSKASSRQSAVQQQQQPERRVLPVSRDRSFSPSQKNKPASANKPRERSSVYAQQQHKERPLSALVKDGGDKADKTVVAKSDQPAHPQQRENRPFSPFDKDKATRPFSPFEKDKISRPFSPFEKDKISRPFSPFEKDKIPRPFSPFGRDKPPRPFSTSESNNKAGRSYSSFDRQKSAPPTSQQGRSGHQIPRDRPFSPFQKDKAATFSQRDRASPSAHREEGNQLMQNDKPTAIPEEERSAPAPQTPKETPAVWDKRASALSNDGALHGFGARNTVVLEQGGKISRV